MTSAPKSTSKFGVNTPKSAIKNGVLQNLLAEHVPPLSDEKYHATDETFLCQQYQEFLKGVAAVTPRLNKGPLQEAAEAIFGVHPREASHFATAMIAAFRHATSTHIVDGTRTSKWILGIREAMHSERVELPTMRSRSFKEEPSPKRCKMEKMEGPSTSKDDSPGSIFKLYNGRSPTPTQRFSWCRDDEPTVAGGVGESANGNHSEGASVGDSPVGAS